jgi:hemolysin activation/secretion protein
VRVLWVAAVLSLGVIGAAGLAVGSASAQHLPFERPGDVRPELPEPGEPEAPEFELPPLPDLPGPSPRLSDRPELRVQEIRVTGSTVFSEEELRAVTAPYLARTLGAEDLHALRDRLTLLYVEAGYVNSGAILPDQDVVDGVVEYRIVEGRLAEVEVQGNRRFRERWLRERLERGATVPLDVHRLERELQILQQDPRIRRVHAELGPGARRGDAVLHARFEEARPWSAELALANDEPPSVGPYHTRLDLHHGNLTGNGDVADLQFGFTDGFEQYALAYEIPVNRWDTTLGARFDWDESDVVENPFDDLDIRSESQTFALRLRQPVYRSLQHQVHLSLDAEYRESETFLLGERFSFPPLPEEDDGQSTVTVVRFAQEWVFRDLAQVLAARSMFSVGLDLLGATTGGADVVRDGVVVHKSGVPDGKFLAWLGQIQWIRRFDPWGVELVLRGDAQLADSPLLSLEQFAVGGQSTVRGYRENELVRDNGVVASVELRVPLWSDAAGRPLLQLAPFYDAGWSWNSDRPQPGPDFLESAGVGLRFAFTRHLEAQIYWGEALRDVPAPDDHDLQDIGIHFRLALSY